MTSPAPTWAEPPDIAASPAPTWAEPPDIAASSAPPEPVWRVRERLLARLIGARTLGLGSLPGDRRLFWLGTLAILAVAVVTRFWRLGQPAELVFDETYYVKDAFTLWRTGFEANWPEDPNPAFEAGDVNTFLDTPAFVVHPQVGKWLIGLGMALGGGPTNPAAWRLASATAGVLAVLLVILIARRLFGSTRLGLVAGVLMTIDGAAIVHSRVALLDQFLMVFVLAAFGALLLDRQLARERLATWAARGDPGVWLGARPWRIVAGVLLGVACGVKWSGIYFLAVFGLLTVCWDLAARHTVGARRWVRTGILKDGLWAFCSLVPVALVTYVATWWSWFTTPGAYERQWATLDPSLAASWMPSALRSFVHYHRMMWNFHTGLDAEHPYAANPLGWIIQMRPTSFYWNRPIGSPTVSTVTSLGNPVLWWIGAACLTAAIVLGLYRWDWRSLAAVSGILAGWVPWFAYLDRTVFTFYVIVFLPWLIFTIIYVLDIALRRADGTIRSKVAYGAYAILLLLVVVSMAFYPVWTALPVQFEYWRALMWNPHWV